MMEKYVVSNKQIVMKSILLLIITLLGCSSNMKQEPISKSGIPVINLSEDVSTVPSLLLSESAEKLEIVPLEMTDQSMLGEIRRIQVTEHDIWSHDFNKFYIYRFSRTGKFLNRIGSIGQAPGEYVNFSTFLVDEYKKVVYIPRHITTPKKQVFAHYAHHWYLHLMHHIKQYDSFHKFRL